MCKFFAKLYLKTRRQIKERHIRLQNATANQNHDGWSRQHYLLPEKGRNRLLSILSKRTWTQHLAHGLSTFLSPAVCSCAWKSHALWEMFERSHLLTGSLVWIIPTFGWMLTEAANAVLSHLDRTPLSRIPDKLETEYVSTPPCQAEIKTISFCWMLWMLWFIKHPQKLVQRFEEA